MLHFIDLVLVNALISLKNVHSEIAAAMLVAQFSKHKKLYAPTQHIAVIAESYTLAQQAYCTTRIEAYT